MEIKTKWAKEKEAAKNSESKAAFGEEMINKAGSYGKIIFWALMIALLIGGGFVSYFIVQYQKSKELNFDVSAPDRILIAKPFEVDVNLENKSQSVLKNPKISLQLPDGAVSLDNNNDMQVIEQNLDDMAPGVLVKKTFKIAFIRDDQTSEKINVNFSYLPETLNTRFEKDQSIEVFVDQPSIDMSLVTPQRVFNRENFQINVNYKNISDFNFDSARLQLVYPDNFTFKSASLNPDSGNAVWNLGELAPGASSTIAINGSLQGADQSFSEIKSQLFVTLDGKEYLINEKNASLGIASSPLSLSVSVNNNPSYVADINDFLTYQIKYRNNTDVGLSDVILKVNLTGEMFDFSSLQSTGFFDSVNNAITWNAGNNPQFKVLAPGTEGTLSFQIRTKAAYPIKRMFDKNYSLKLQAEINSPTVPYNVSSDKTVGLANLETKVMGRSEITASLVYVSGAFPVKANQPTVYEVHWQIKNYSTDITNVKVSSFLQSGVKWLNVTKSDIDAAPVYDDRTGQVSWAIDKILATKGVISNPLEAVFQVEMTPNITQAGQQAPVLNETSLTATDDFTGASLSAKTDVLKTVEIVAQ